MELAWVTQTNVVPCHLRHSRRSYYHCWLSSYLGSMYLATMGWLVWLVLPWMNQPRARNLHGDIHPLL